MPDYGYSALISEVRTTNDLLEVQNEKIDNLITNVKTVGVFIVALIVVKGADVLRQILNNCYKK